MKIKFIYPKFEIFRKTYPEPAEFTQIAATGVRTESSATGIPILVNALPPGG